jgi:hypothetical protein
MRKLLLVSFLILLFSAGFIFARIQRQTQSVLPTKTKTNEPEIIVEYPKPNDIVTSPLIIKGKAKGTWFFEGDFPLVLYYGVGDDWVEGYATAKGEWMTEDYVDFEGTLEFPVPPTNDGKLILTKNNPSDIEGSHDSIEIKVYFH